jgi:hypothetical protein
MVTESHTLDGMVLKADTVQSKDKEGTALCRTSDLTEAFKSSLNRGLEKVGHYLEGSDLAS